MKFYVFFTAILLAGILQFPTEAEEANIFDQLNAKTNQKTFLSSNEEIKDQENETPYGELSFEEYDEGIHPFLLRSSRRRRSDECAIPSKVETYGLSCIKYPNYVSCRQICKFGYTLKEGIQRTMTCNYTQDEWKPKPEFEDCLPFIDCKVTIGPGGSQKCKVDFDDRGPICEISCQLYEDKPAVPVNTYECDIEGNWKPKLPHCAKPRSGIKLVSPPIGLKIPPKI